MQTCHLISQHLEEKPLQSFAMSCTPVAAISLYFFSSETDISFLFLANKKFPMKTMGLLNDCGIHLTTTDLLNHHCKIVVTLGQSNDDLLNGLHDLQP